MYKDSAITAVFMSLIKAQFGLFYFCDFILFQSIYVFSASKCIIHLHRHPFLIQIQFIQAKDSKSVLAVLLLVFVMLALFLNDRGRNSDGMSFHFRKIASTSVLCSLRYCLLPHVKLALVWLKGAHAVNPTPSQHPPASVKLLQKCFFFGVSF